MKILVSQTSEFDIEPQEHKKLTLEYFRKYFDWHPRYFLEKNKTEKELWVYESVICCDGDEEEKKIRKASMIDVLVNSMVAEIKKKKHETA